MMKKRLFVLLTGMAVILTVGCGNKEENLTDSGAGRKKEKSEASIKKVRTLEMPITFVNDTDMDIYSLYASSTETDDWEEDILEETVLEPGEYVKVDFTYTEEETTWDFAIKDNDDNMLEYYDMDFENYGSDGITIYFNQDGTAKIGRGADEYETFLKEMEAQDSWKEEYIDYINTHEQKGYNTKYALLYIDSDEIPELYIDYGYNAAGGELCTVHRFEGENYFDSIVCGTGISYLARENMICDTGGSTGYCYNNLYIIEDAGFLEVFHGEYKEDDGNGIMLDEDGEVIHTYYLDGQRVSEEDYWSSYYSCYDEERSVSSYDQLMDKDTLLSVLNDR